MIELWCSLVFLEMSFHLTNVWWHFAWYTFLLYTVCCTCTESDDYSFAALSFGESIHCPSARRVMLWPTAWTVSSHIKIGPVTGRRCSNLQELWWLKYQYLHNNQEIRCLGRVNHEDLNNTQDSSFHGDWPPKVWSRVITAVDNLRATASTVQCYPQVSHRSQQQAHSDCVTFKKGQSRHELRRSRDRGGCLKWSTRQTRDGWCYPNQCFWFSDIQAWGDPCGTQICSQALGDQCERLTHVQVSKGRSSRDLESVQLSEMEKERILSEQKSIHEFLEEEADQAFQGEFAVQMRLLEAQAELDRREWERRNADIALYETGRKLECQRMDISGK